MTKPQHLIDLHTHSTCSDGTLTPTELMERAHQLGLHTIALTDHDTLDGIGEAQAAAERLDLRLITGVEISTIFGSGEFAGKEFHILGLDLDETNPALLAAFETLRNFRAQRNEDMLAAFHAHGIPLDRGDLYATANGENLTKAHFARLLIRRGYAEHFDDAFGRFLSPGCPTHVDKRCLEPKQAIELINQGGGVAILAHPYRYRLSDNQLVDLAAELTALGLGGIEAIYNNHLPDQEIFLRAVADENKLVISGGTDFHGANKAGIQLGSGRGNMQIPLRVWENIRDYKEKRGKAC